MSTDGIDSRTEEIEKTSCVFNIIKPFFIIDWPVFINSLNSIFAKARHIMTK